MGLVRIALRRSGADQVLTCADDSSSVSPRHEMQHLRHSRLRVVYGANESAIISKVGRQSWVKPHDVTQEVGVFKPMAVAIQRDD